MPPRRPTSNHYAHQPRPTCWARWPSSMMHRLAGLSAALFATGGPAPAAVPSSDGSGARIVALPPAPGTVGPAVSAKAACGASPTTSPAVRTEHGPPGSTYVCDAGTLCTNVWDPTTSDRKTLFIYSCNRYYLSD
ncbi:hypothetical protein QFZ22_009737 [Streptomyces canus]|uniref:Subtilisin inhibitor domain-containing protein n=1 Tax=Streptomyces canus TaxID=58343 RepID=A0AAW8FWK5_9ACTN|nr:hypothetical protein [Streptomyces canus]